MQLDIQTVLCHVFHLKKGGCELTSVTFTGDRANHFIFGNDETEALCKMIKREMVNQIRWLYEEKGARNFYSGCVYPEGIFPNQNLFLFNDEDMNTLVFTGYVGGDSLEKLKVLIVDDDASLCSDLFEQFDKNSDFEVVQPIHDGTEALEYIKSNKPDIIILDFILSACDGLYIINYIHRYISNYKPFIYVMSVLGIEKTNTIMMDLRVDYFSVKPVSPHVIFDNVIRLVNKSFLSCSINILEVGEDYPCMNVEYHVEAYLTKLGVPIYLRSTRCTRRAIQMVLDNTSLMSNMNKLYTEIGQNLLPTLTGGGVYRNIRSTIQYAATGSNPYFAECFENYQSKITASVFLGRSVQIVRAYAYS